MTSIEVNGFKASLISAWRMAWFLDYRECLWRYAGFAKNLLKLWTHYDMAPDKVVEARNIACRGCDLFCAQYGTCGIPGDTYTNPHTGRRETFGCWCHTETANRIGSKDCWGRIHNLGVGWPDAIRPTQPN